MGYLNGVIYPNYITVSSFLVKLFGVMFAVSAGLCGGKEGPLVHLGACIGVMTLYIPGQMFKYFRNDSDKRRTMAMGIAAGISAAFGAPIGGSLFAFEIS